MKINFSNAQIKLLAEKVISLILVDQNEDVVRILKPLLDRKCPFPKLDLLGRQLGRAGKSQPEKFFKAFNKIINYNAMGSFVVVGQALIHFLEDNFDKVMKKSREYIIKGNIWYVTDIIGERSIGQALVDYFDKSLPWLEEFLNDGNKWVKRSAGTAIHFFSKRVPNEPQKTKKLLKLIEHCIEEKNKDAAKGIGWGLKTIGKHHPQLLVDFLKKQLKNNKKISKIIIRKALTYLEEDKKRSVRKLSL